VVEERFADPDLQLADAAAAAGLSRAHFSHLFHKKTGTTFTRYVQNRRIAEAKRLLEETTRSITEICYDCGFNSLTHFNRVFRRGARCSPSAFRKQVRQGP
jgi:AraC-like DNA-binding protein